MSAALQEILRRGNLSDSAADTVKGKVKDFKIDNRHIWQGSQQRSYIPSISSHYPAFDQALKIGGWPLNRLTELLLKQLHVGEVQLILPAIAEAMQNDGWLFLINPPFMPYAPAWIKSGIAIERMRVIRCTQEGEQAWACEQVMANSSVAACLFWPSRDHLANKVLKRLQLASTQGSSLNFIFRTQQAMAQSSPASLRLLINLVEPSDLIDLKKRQLKIEIIKQPQGWNGQSLLLDLDQQVSDDSQVSDIHQSVSKKSLSESQTKNQNQNQNQNHNQTGVESCSG